MAGTSETDPPTTVRDASGGATPPTQSDHGDDGAPIGSTPATRREASDPLDADRSDDRDRTLTNLPGPLRVDYRIVQELGASGAEADLLLVEHRTSHQQYVAKIYRRNISLDEDTVDRIRSAAREHVVVTEAAGHSHGRWYELLEYVEAGSLAALLQREGPMLEPGLVEEIVNELAPALHHLHGLGVVHRDLKPANVLVRTRSPLDLVLADFGLAAVAEQSIVFLSASRTAAYAAPEAMSGSVSAARDYWSLGMIILEALTGAHPFAGLSQAVIDAQIATRPIDLSTIDDERWLLLCKGLLTRDPDLRWGADQLQRWLDGQSPAVALEAKPSPTAKQPYLIGASRAETREELATALADNWAEARDRIGRDQFLPWFELHWPDTNVAADAHRVLEPVGAAKGKGLANAEVKLYRLIHLLDPSVAPRFRSGRFDPSGLRWLAHHAVRGERNCVAVVEAVHELNLLTVLGESTPPHLAELADRWQRWRSELRTAAAAAAAAGAPDIARTVLDNADVQLFHYAVNPDLVEDLRRNALAIHTPATSTQGWYVAIGDPSDIDAPRLLLLIALAASAERQGTAQVVADRAERRRRRRAVALGGLALAVLGLIAALSPWLDRPRKIDFDAHIEATTANCSSGKPVSATQASEGIDLTCTMSDDVPGNGDRPYVQVRFDGCDEWERLDHDDGPDPVTITTKIPPCEAETGALDWQVCQTHGGPLPDDCHDGNTDLPAG